MVSAQNMCNKRTEPQNNYEYVNMTENVHC